MGLPLGAAGKHPRIRAEARTSAYRCYDFPTPPRRYPHAKTRAMQLVPPLEYGKIDASPDLGWISTEFPRLSTNRTPPRQAVDALVPG